MTTYPADFCPDCGTALASRHVDGRERRYCEDCERVVWQNPAPGAGVAVVADDGVLLTRRDVEPGVGEWTLPGGHLEVEETPRVAGARELEEETGVRVDPDDLRIVGAFNTSPFEGKHVVSVRFAVRAEQTTGTPEPGPEVQAVEWFTPEAFATSGHVFHEPHDAEFDHAWDLLGPD